MTDQDGVEEIVMLFDDDGRSVVAEHRLAEFDSFIERTTTFDQHAASIVKAAYAIVGSGLVVRALVFFTFKVDEDGYIGTDFNVPLGYLADNAGTGPDLGHGVIRLACRGQCPVPWQANNLWEPEGEGDESPAMLVQKCVWRNKLELRPMGDTGHIVEQSEDTTQWDLDDGLTDAFDEEGDLELTDGIDTFRESRSDNGAVRRPPPSREQLEARLTETFGEEGKVSLEKFMRQHNDQLLEAKQRFRDDLHEQQQNYLEQIRGLRDDLHSMKAKLRHEQDRNRRLQELLRGDV